MYRSTDGVNFQPAAPDARQFIVDGLIWTDVRVSSKQTYWYRIAAFDFVSNQESAPSAVVQVTIP